MRQQSRTGSACFAPAAAVCWDFLEKGKLVPFANIAENGHLGGKKNGVTTGNRKGMRKTPSREIAVEMKNGRLLRRKKHYAETELSQSWAAEVPAKGPTEILGWPRKLFKSLSVKQDWAFMSA